MNGASMWEDYLRWFREENPELLAGPHHIRMRTGGAEAVYDFICQDTVFSDKGVYVHTSPFRHFGTNRIKKHLQR